MAVMESLQGWNRKLGSSHEYDSIRAHTHTPQGGSASSASGRSKPTGKVVGLIGMTRFDEIVKSRKTPFSVIPAKAGHVVTLFKPSGATLSAIQ